MREGGGWRAGEGDGGQGRGEEEEEGGGREHYLLLYEAPEFLDPLSILRMLTGVRRIKEDLLIVPNPPHDGSVNHAIEEHAQWVDAEGLVRGVDGRQQLDLLVLALHGLQGNAKGVQLKLEGTGVG